MSGFSPRDPGFRARIESSFAGQGLMRTLGVTMLRLDPGEVDLAFPAGPGLTQQHGFVHAGAVTSALDTACGYAAMSLMEPGAEVLTVEFKVSFLAPARGRQILCRGRVIRSGRTITVCEGEALADGDAQAPVARISATMIAQRPAR